MDVCRYISIHISYMVFLLVVSIENNVPHSSVGELKCHMKALEKITVTITVKVTQHCHMSARVYKFLAGPNSHI